MHNEPFVKLNTPSPLYPLGVEGQICRPAVDF